MRLNLLRSKGLHIWESELYRLRGELHRNDVAAAQDEVMADFERALDIARQQQAPGLVLRAAISLSHWLQQHGQIDDAYHLLAMVYGGFSEGLDTLDLRLAQERLAALSRSSTDTESSM